MGELFGVELHPHNRWGGAKLLRERWQSHIDASLSRPVLIVDEGQEMQLPVLASCACCAQRAWTRTCCSPSCWPAISACSSASAR